MGVNLETGRLFMTDFEVYGSMDRTILFINLANCPSIGGIFMPILALTTGEYLVEEKEKQVLTNMTDMSSYANAAREITGCREEVSGDRGYPG